MSAPGNNIACILQEMAANGTIIEDQRQIDASNTTFRKVFGHGIGFRVIAGDPDVDLYIDSRGDGQPEAGTSRFIKAETGLVYSIPFYSVWAMPAAGLTQTLEIAFIPPLPSEIAHLILNTHRPANRQTARVLDESTAVTVQTAIAAVAGSRIVLLPGSYIQNRSDNPLGVTLFDGDTEMHTIYLSGAGTATEKDGDTFHLLGEEPLTSGNAFKWQNLGTSGEEVAVYCKYRIE